MGKIVLQFAESTSLGGRVIEWYDHGRFAHVDTVLDDSTLLGARDDRTGNVPPGVQIRPASYLGTSKTYRVELSCTDDQELAYITYVTQQIGKPYDEDAIAGFILGRNWYKEGSWFCSELVAAALICCGYLRALVAPANKIAPDDLLLVLSAMQPILLPPM